MKRIDLLVYDRPQYIKEYLGLFLGRFETCNELGEFLTEELPEKQVSQFKQIAKADVTCPLREYFRATYPEEVKEWERLDKEREKRQYYVTNKIPYEIGEDGTVTKKGNGK